MLGRPGPIYIVANKEGKDVAVRCYGDPETFKLTSEAVQEMHGWMELKAENEMQKMQNNPGVFLVGGLGSSSISLKQNTSVFRRVMTYLDYLVKYGLTFGSVLPARTSGIPRQYAAVQAAKPILW